MPMVRPGQVIRIEEEDYAYGVGALTLRVTGLAPHDDPAWIRVTGVEIHWTGGDGPRREVLVRSSAQVSSAADRAGP
ncbi:hypothetical protein GCM10010124_11680 [Pilimelia terevasa]|uniref:Uncharacterized protein n=1 Tax=Pilimelia terevasa TaxID=53372 RepID=A0A8J3BM07_9ACTN|nr:hypothetical protein [Pilimelia terevasa]GGK20827.1 hypothetical protein GCM10010124_11680 [Pilimelia terevasa]